MEKRELFERFCDLLFMTGRVILKEVFMDKCVGPQRDIPKYFRSDGIFKAVHKCKDFTQRELDLMYPPGGASPLSKMFGLPLLCRLISILLIKSFKASDGDSATSKDKSEPTCRDLVTQISDIHKKHSSNELLEIDKTTHDLINIYKKLVKGLSPGKKFDELSQIIERTETFHKETNIDGGTDKQISLHFDITTTSDIDCWYHSTLETPSDTDMYFNQLQHLSSTRRKHRKETGKKCRNLSKKNERTVEEPHNSRPGQTIEISVTDMELYCQSGERIDKGQFGVLYKGVKIKEDESETYLIKKLELTNEDHKTTYYTELYHETILHPHVVPIIGRAETTSQDPSVVYLMYPYMENGNVRENIIRENDGKLLCAGYTNNSGIWLRCIYQVASALDYLHNKGKHGLRGPVFHRNLTSRTILFNEFFNAKLCDFGKAVEAKHDASDATDIQFFSVPGYHPMKMKMDRTRYTASYDVYSFCVVILEILTGEVVEDENCFADYKNDSECTSLLMKIKTRAETTSKIVEWSRPQLRATLAKKAWEVIKLDGTETAEVKAADFLQIVKDARVESYRLYEKENTSCCVSCYINPKAKNLPLKGEQCKKDCTEFCVHCLSDYHNQLICPLHGPTRPPFGDHVYGVFVAGNHVSELQDQLIFHGDHPMTVQDIAKIFTRDAKKLVNVLTSKFPLVLGARTEHFKVVTPKKHGKEGQMIGFIKKSFGEINNLIRQELNNYPNNNRLENSLFIFFFTGHSNQKEESKKNSTQKNVSKTNVLYLGGIKETINDTTEWLREMLHKTLLVDNVLVILDCCHAAQHNFVKEKEESGVAILQLSSCDTKQKSMCDETRGSYFTHFLCQALQGVDIVESNEEVSNLCKDCKMENTYRPCDTFHRTCSDSQTVTMNDVETYIQSHYELLKLQKDVKKHATNAGKIELVYYKHPYKSSISIHLEGSECEKMYSFSAAPESISHLRKDITRYIEEKKIQCQILDMLEFHDKLDRSLEDSKARLKYLMKSTSPLVAIYQVSEKETKELTSLNDLWKIRPSLMSLVAKIRCDVKELRNGPVKCDRIKRAMTISCQESYFKKLLGVSQDNILVCHVQKIEEVLKEIESLESKKIFGETKWLLNNLYQILVTCKGAGVFDVNKEKLLKLRLHKKFSILELE